MRHTLPKSTAVYSCLLLIIDQFIQRDGLADKGFSEKCLPNLAVPVQVSEIAVYRDLAGIRKERR
jgi:hypothetical protein